MISCFQPLVFCIGMLLVQLPGWTFRFNKDGVNVSTRETPGSAFNAFKGTATLPYPAERIASVIQDVAAYPCWCYQTSSTEIIRKENNRIYYRAVTLTPPLVKNREVYSYTERISGITPGEIILVIKSTESSEPVPDDFVRMPYSNGRWRLVSLSVNSTLVEFEMEADPGGSIPAWLANRASVDAPWQTIKRLLWVLENEH